jgi:hypothetical protein
MGATEGSQMNRSRTCAAVACCLAMAIPTTAIAADIVGTVNRVMDGDSFEIA